VSPHRHRGVEGRASPARCATARPRASRAVRRVRAVARSQPCPPGTAGRFREPRERADPLHGCAQAARPQSSDSTHFRGDPVETTGVAPHVEPQHAEAALLVGRACGTEPPAHLAPRPSPHATPTHRQRRMRPPRFGPRRRAGRVGEPRESAERSGSHARPQKSGVSPDSPAVAACLGSGGDEPCSGSRPAPPTSAKPLRLLPGWTESRTTATPWTIS
jgi:hypothetical protein